MYKRYIYKKGKKHGPYYYENIKDENGKIKTIYLGSRPPHEQIKSGKKFTVTKTLLILFLIILFLIILASLYLLFSNQNIIIGSKTEKLFNVDSILIKILLKNGENSVNTIRVTNIADKMLSFSVTPTHLDNLVTLTSENSEFRLMPGEIKTVEINFNSKKSDSVEFSPGVYVGDLIITTTDAEENFIQKIPVIIEIETKETLFDVNLDVPAESRTVMQGTNILINVKIFNLRSVKAQSVNLDYFVKDLDGNTIIREKETVIVPKTQLAFKKTINIPQNLEEGTYIFAASVSFGSNVGTSSYMFNIVKSLEKRLSPSEFLRSCYLSSTCYATAIVLIVFMFFFIICFFFLLYLFRKIEKVEKPKIRKIKEIQDRIDGLKIGKKPVKPVKSIRTVMAVKLKSEKKRKGKKNWLEKNKWAWIILLIIFFLTALYFLQYYFLDNKLAEGSINGLKFMGEEIGKGFSSLSEYSSEIFSKIFGFFGDIPTYIVEFFEIINLGQIGSKITNFILASLVSQFALLAVLVGGSSLIYEFIKQNGLYFIIAIIGIIIATSIILYLKKAEANVKRRKRRKKIKKKK